MTSEGTSRRLSRDKIREWTIYLRGFKPLSQEDMQICVQEHANYYEVFKDILGFFNEYVLYTLEKGYPKKMVESAIIEHVRNMQQELGLNPNFNKVKIAGIKQFIKVYDLWYSGVDIPAKSKKAFTEPKKSSETMYVFDPMKNSRKNQWSDWLLLRTEDFGSIPNFSGIYEIRSAIEGQPQPICRAKEVDYDGLLYIGCADFLRYEIASFWRYIRSERKESPNMAAYAYRHFDYYLRFKPEQLEVRWWSVSEGDVNLERAMLIHRYVWKYCDRPLLNTSIKKLH